MLGIIAMLVLKYLNTAHLWRVFRFGCAKGTNKTTWITIFSETPPSILLALLSSMIVIWIFNT